MRRNPLIINLYDKPHSSRSYGRESAPSASAGSALLACATIALCVGVFFWLYDAVIHRGPPFVPVLAHEMAVGPRSAAAAVRPMPPDALAPDLHSPAVVLANADVPALPAGPEAAAAKHADAAVAEKPKKAEAPPRKKRVRAVKRLPPAAAQSYAAEPGFFRGGSSGF